MGLNSSQGLANRLRCLLNAVESQSKGLIAAERLIPNTLSLAHTKRNKSRRRTIVSLFAHLQGGDLSIGSNCLPVPGAAWGAKGRDRRTRETSG
jgi:hypothetical protein